MNAITSLVRFLHFGTESFQNCQLEICSSESWLKDETSFTIRLLVWNQYLLKSCETAVKEDHTNLFFCFQPEKLPAFCSYSYVIHVAMKTHFCKEKLHWMSISNISGSGIQKQNKVKGLAVARALNNHIILFGKKVKNIKTWNSTLSMSWFEKTTAVITNVEYCCH